MSRSGLFLNKKEQVYKNFFSQITIDYIKNSIIYKVYNRYGLKINLKNELIFHYMQRIYTNYKVPVYFKFASESYLKFRKEQGDPSIKDDDYCMTNSLITETIDKLAEDVICEISERYRYSNDDIKTLYNYPSSDLQTFTKPKVNYSDCVKSSFIMKY